MKSIHECCTLAMGIAGRETRVTCNCGRVWVSRVHGPGWAWFLEEPTMPLVGRATRRFVVELGAENEAEFDNNFVDQHELAKHLRTMILFSPLNLSVRVVVLTDADVPVMPEESRGAGSV